MAASASLVQTVQAPDRSSSRAVRLGSSCHSPSHAIACQGFATTTASLWEVAPFR